MCLKRTSLTLCYTLMFSSIALAAPVPTPAGTVAAITTPIVTVTPVASVTAAPSPSPVSSAETIIPAADLKDFVANRLESPDYSANSNIECAIVVSQVGGYEYCAAKPRATPTTETGVCCRILDSAKVVAGYFWTKASSCLPIDRAGLIKSPGACRAADRTARAARGLARRGLQRLIQ